jgi:hypothetical protein
VEQCPRAQLDSLLALARVAGGDHDDGHHLEVREGLEALHHDEAVSGRQADVEQDQVGSLTPSDGESGGGVGRERRFVTRACQL